MVCLKKIKKLLIFRTFENNPKIMTDCIEEII